MLTEEQMRTAMINPDGRWPTGIVPFHLSNAGSRWPNGEVPFVIDSVFSEYCSTKLQIGMGA